ncbi:c-5 sterol desaturase [Lecanicillium sp. MT-2017a]|nr:c-5 sterol desaturase [Lecanicillium sp. MT-2017a]
MDTALEILDPLVFDQAYAYFFPGPSVACDSLSSAVWSTSGLNAAANNATASIAAGAKTCIVSSLPRDDIRRQCASILFVAGFGAATLYFIFAAFSYYFVFDRRLEYHPRFLKNQIAQEIKSSLWAIPFIDLLSLPFFLAEVRGYSLLYTDISEYGWSWVFISTLLYMIFNDFFIYWIHRLEHHPSVYKYVHKPHHKWIVPTPWAAIAFHPVDGFLQSTPYHIFVFICPMQKYLYAVLFILVQLWTIFIHDGDMITGTWSEKFINSPAHHTLHHMYFTCNYGQYFTWADNYFDSHREPRPELDPIHEALKVMREKGLVDEKGNPINKKTQ